MNQSANQEISLEKSRTECLNCGSPMKDYIYAKDRYAPTISYKYLKCNKCGLVQLQSRTENNNFEAYNMQSKISFLQKMVYALHLHRLKQFKRTGKVLDFGAGAGNLSSYMAEHGFDVECFEVDAEYVRWMQYERGLKVIPKITEKYDVITSETVFEHLQNPQKSLIELKDNLKEDGIMMISIPKLESWQFKVFKENWFHLDAPRHLNHFDKGSFEKIIENAGLQIKKVYYFNLHIDPTGWIWSRKNPQSINYKLTSIKNIFLLGLSMPLVILSSMFKRTAYNLYVLEKK